LSPAGTKRPAGRTHPARSARTGGAKPTIRRTEYSSGLRIVSEEMPTMRSIALGIWVDVGSRDERPNLSGASHFLEHLLFKGTATRTAHDIASAFDAVGGDLNAFTSKENTCYYCRVRDQDLAMAVEFMTDMLQHSVLARPDFEQERLVIIEEINRQDDAPDDLIHDLFVETLWKGHPLGRPVLGTRDTIRGVSRDQVYRFYRRRYEPSNFVIAAAGNFRHDDLCALVERHTDAGDRLSDVAARKLRSGGDGPHPSGLHLVRRRTTEQAHIVLGTTAYSRRDPERFAFGVVNSAVGGGMSSRLFQEIREKRGLAYSVYSYHSMFAETGYFAIYAGTTPTNAHDVIRIAREQIADVAEHGLTDEELDRAKGHMKGSLVLSLEDTSGRMSRIGRSEISHGEILSVDEILERIEAVTAEDARTVARDVFGRTLTLSVIGPFDETDFADDVPGNGSGPAAAGVAAAHGGAGPA
jgi:predicted Zn-dependent peptidase